MASSDGVLDFFTALIGGVLTILLAVTSLLCSLPALLSISEENRFFFERALRTVGIVISLFGLLLPFRHISLIGTLICFGWTLLIYNLIPFFQIMQLVILSFASLVFWVIHIYHSNESALQNIPDFVIYVIVPFIFTFVNLSRGSESLSAKDRTNTPRANIPLRSYTAKCYSYLEQIFPQSK